MAALRRCPRCGNTLPSDVAMGLCPACLLGAGLEPSREEVTFGFEPTHPGHVLEDLARSVGPIPRVLLPDTANDDAGVAVIKPSSDEMPSASDRGDRYQLFGEIARGGMGAVLKGRDPDLGRDLAVKVLLESHQAKPELVRRFVEEAQIGGQLQHPGIVPVYELGTFADRRPYFTMKLVKGRTLASLLAERQTPAHDLPRFLSIFEAVCQTMAYAHARGVIHRDLKPSNVMVGSFGEVQVMDWGLAKVLKEGGIADEQDAPPTPAPAVSVIATVRSGSDVDDSLPGSMLGTPAYMAPEQASGELEHVDRRADVFGLGAILCEILTGQPAYTGRSQHELIRKAMRGDTGDALGRLDRCGVEAELVSLAKDCLAVEPEDRPRDAGLVAARITAYLSSVQARVQEAERERAVAVARAVEERRRRKLQLGLAASVLALTTLGGMSTAYYFQQRQARATAVDRILGQAVTLRDQAAAQPEDVARWQVAMAAVEQADVVSDPRAGDRLLALSTEIKSGLDAAQRDRTLLDRLVDIRSAEADDPDGSATDAAYADAFRDAGLDLDSLQPAEAGAMIRARPPSVAMAIAGALDDWAAIRRDRRKESASSARLSEAARDADPDPWRNELRATLGQADKTARLTALQALAKGAKFESLSAISLHLLGTGLKDAGDAALAESVLRTAQQNHPQDVWVNYALGTVLEKLFRRDEAIRFYTAARAIRRETAHELAHALAARGDTNEAIAVFRDLKELRPADARHPSCLGQALIEKGLSRESNEALQAAEAAGRAAIRLKPDSFSAHLNLGLILARQGRHEEAIAEYRIAVRLRPDDSGAHERLGIALARPGNFEQGIKELRTALRLKPDSAQAHDLLGEVLKNQGRLDESIIEYREAIRLRPDYAWTYLNLGNALGEQKRVEESIASYREAIRLKPDYAIAHNNLGTALKTQGKLDEAVAEYRQAIRISPDHVDAHYNLGNELWEQGKVEESIAELREAIRLKPDYADAHGNLGNVMMAKGKLDEAIAAYRAAIRLQPDNPLAHYNLGLALVKQGKLDDAIAEWRTALRLKPDYAEAYTNVGVALSEQGKLDEAVAEHREAIRRKPDYPDAHNNLGSALTKQRKFDEAIAELRQAIRLKPDFAIAHDNLCNVLKAQGKLDEAITACREAIRLGPKNSSIHNNLGNALADQGKVDEAITEFHEAIRLSPDLAWPHNNLGAALARQGKMNEAVAAYREAIRLKPDYAEAHNNLGDALKFQGKLDQGIASCREAIRLKPDFAIAHYNLGLILQRQGEFAGALESLRRAHELGSRMPNWRYPSAQLVKIAERSLALSNRFPTMLNGEDLPKDNAERLAFAQMAYDRKHFGTAARLWSEALANEPKLGDSRQTQHRYNAACSAALVAAGQGKDEPKPDDGASVKLRQQALDWLKAELKTWEKLLDSGPPQARPVITKTMEHWKQDTDFASVRDADALNKLPPDEQQAWRSLWADVDALTRRASTPR